ncbi:DNA helicase MCM8, putative [Plasmodium ovale]|uniref:DNA helicase n=1 Tax=Plasmodium ovale TaxID=36330 RepID=A0A1D3TM53_PLAOA|nr:DNA helicase MCM8, putative [Plasmodium ovale]
MDTIVQLYFTGSELNDDVKRLILSWVTFFKDNWSFLFNVDKEVILNLEFFLDTKKVIGRNAPPNNEVFLHELKKNPLTVLKFMKVSLHLLLCRFLGLDKEDAHVGTKGKGGKCDHYRSQYGKRSRSSRSSGSSGSRGSSDVGSIVSGRGRAVAACEAATASGSEGGTFIRGDEIQDVGVEEDRLINELRSDRCKDSEAFRNYFQTNRVIIYLYNWNKVNKFKNLKSEKVNQLVCLRGSILRISPVQLLITKIDFICEKCKCIFSVEFIDGKFESPKNCLNKQCDCTIFFPIRESAKSVEYQKIVLKENKKLLSQLYDTRRTNTKRLTVTLETSNFFINTCILGTYVEALGILKVISNNNNFLVNGKNSLFNMYIDCLSVFPLSSKKCLNDNYFNIERVKQAKQKIFTSGMWLSYIGKMTKKVTLLEITKRDVYTQRGKNRKDSSSQQGNLIHEEETQSWPGTHTSVELFPIIRETNNRMILHTDENDKLKKISNISMDKEKFLANMDTYNISSLSAIEDGRNLSTCFNSTNETKQGKNNCIPDGMKSNPFGNNLSEMPNDDPLVNIPSDEYSSDTSSSLCMYGDYIIGESNVVKERSDNMQGVDTIWENLNTQGGYNSVVNSNTEGSDNKKEIDTEKEDLQFSSTRSDLLYDSDKFDEKVIEFVRDMEIYKSNKFYLLVASFCPRVIMNDYVKAGLLLTLLGGKTLYDESNRIRRRGNIHSLLVGDPGVGKSRILQYISNLIDNSLFICSTATTINGLTACAVKDVTTNDYSLEGGALVLTDKGVCCIDELDKISLTDQQSFLECMESQCIHISKAGIICDMKTRCTIIAASNPKEGKYNYEKTIMENMKIFYPLLSRFDLVFLLTDKVSEEKDYTISNQLICSNATKESNIAREQNIKHTMSMSGGIKEGNANIGNIDKEEDNSPNSPFFSFKDNFLHKCKQIDVQSYLPTELLGVFINYSRKCIFPTLSDEAKKYIRKFYIHIRNLAATNITFSIPITIRQLESLIRLCQARARADLTNVVTLEHAKEVVEIYQKTIFYPLYLKALNFRRKTATQKGRGKSAASLSAVFKENLLQFVKQGGNRIANKDLQYLAKSIILSADSSISDEALIHFVNNEGFILYKGGHWEVDSFYLK